jgi:hypothetical protein
MAPQYNEVRYFDNEKALLLFSQIALAIWGRLYFYMYFNNDFSIYVKNDIGIF